jgi:hypothetical protein
VFLFLIILSINWVNLFWVFNKLTNSDLISKLVWSLLNLLLSGWYWLKLLILVIDLLLLGLLLRHISLEELVIWWLNLLLLLGHSRNLNILWLHNLLGTIRPTCSLHRHHLHCIKSWMLRRHDIILFLWSSKDSDSAYDCYAETR